MSTQTILRRPQDTIQDVKAARSQALSLVQGVQLDSLAELLNQKQAEHNALQDEVSLMRKLFFVRNKWGQSSSLPSGIQSSTLPMSPLRRFLDNQETRCKAYSSVPEQQKQASRRWSPTLQISTTRSTPRYRIMLHQAHPHQLVILDHHLPPRPLQQQRSSRRYRAFISVQSLSRALGTSLKDSRRSKSCLS